MESIHRGFGSQAAVLEALRVKAVPVKLKKAEPGQIRQH